MNNWTEKFRNALTYSFLLMMALFSLFPFLWMVISATNTSNEITKGKITIGSALFDNYAKFESIFNVGLVFWNSAKIAVVGSLLTLLVSSLAGYGFEIFRSSIRERVYQGVLLSMMIPFAAMMIPMFILMASADLLDTHMAVILPMIASAYIIFFFGKLHNFRWRISRSIKHPNECSHTCSRNNLWFIASFFNGLKRTNMSKTQSSTTAEHHSNFLL